jgi:hypothetical protein
MTKSTEKRPPIPTKIQFKLWLAAGGRCEFPGCNALVYKDGLTLKEVNWSNISHIVSWSPLGPRGDQILSPKLATEFSNLMLMCGKHAHLIDVEPYVTEYPVYKLRRIKEEHERRIETLTAVTNEAKTHVIVIQSNIGTSPVEVNLKEVNLAITENRMYPSDIKPYLIDLTGDSGNGDETFYKAKAMEISTRVKAFLDVFNSASSRQHISVFPLALMPLLVHFGKELGDKHSIQLFQHHRTPSDWLWSDNDNYSEYIVNSPDSSDGSSKDVFLKISLSDYIGADKLATLPNISRNVYEITIPNPTTSFLINKNQIPKFDVVYRQVLNQIQLIHGTDCQIHLLLAAPAPIAVQCGLSLLSRKDPSILVYDYDSQKKGFFKALVV